MKIIAAILEPAVITKILDHLGQPFQGDKSLLDEPGS